MAILFVRARTLMFQILSIVHSTVVHVAVNHGLGKHRSSIRKWEFDAYSKVQQNPHTCYPLRAPSNGSFRLDSQARFSRLWFYVSPNVRCWWFLWTWRLQDLQPQGCVCSLYPSYYGVWQQHLHFSSNVRDQTSGISHQVNVLIK